MSRITTYLVAFAASLVCSGSAFADTYFASPEGGGNGSNASSPMSWSLGLSSLQSGDSLYLLGGTYSLNDKLNIGPSKSGTSDKRTFIGAYPGHKPVFDFRMQPYGKEETEHDNQGFSINSGVEYIHIKGLTICYAGKNGLINAGNYCLFELLDVYGCGDSGIQMKNGGNNTILNCDSHDNFDYKLDKSGNLTACDFGGNADGFADKQFEGPGNHYIGCRAWNNSDDGWDFFQRVSTTQTIMEHCVCYANGPAFYDMRNHPRYEKDKAWFDQFAGSGMDVIDADENPLHVTLENYPNLGNGNGFKLGGRDTEHNAIVHHCLSVANTVKGFDQNSDAGTLYLYNNTSYDNAANYGFYNPNGCQLYIQNCISYKPRKKDSFADGIVQVSDHNSWNSGMEVSDADFESLDESLVLAARQPDGSLPQNGLLRPVSGSRLINSGTDVGFSFYGSAPDLGCYEKYETKPCPSMANAVFHWQANGSVAPPNDTTLQAVGGTVYIGSKDPAKKVSTETAQYVEGTPAWMKAADIKAYKSSSDGIYLTLKPESGSFIAGDTIYICGYSPWKISSSLTVMIDSIQTGKNKSTYDYNYLVLPADMDSIVLIRARKNTSTGIAAVMVCRDPAMTPEVINDVVLESRMWNIGEEDLDGIDTLRSPMAVRQLHWMATTKGYMVVEACPDKNLEGFTFNRRLRTSGQGTGDERYVWFGVKGDCTIDVFVASTSSSEERTLYVATGKVGEVVASYPAPPAQPAMQTYHYSGGLTRICLYGSGGLSIYGIRLTYPDFPTGVQPITNDQLPMTNKFLRNGQLYLLYQGRMYDVQGNRVK